jgi:hypothetical protein
MIFDHVHADICQNACPIKNVSYLKFIFFIMFSRDVTVHQTQCSVLIAVLGSRFVSVQRENKLTYLIFDHLEKDAKLTQE